MSPQYRADSLMIVHDLIANFAANITRTNVCVALAVVAVYALLHQLFFRPLIFSPLRNVPGPSFGHLLYGQMRNFVRAEPGMLLREWAAKHGEVVRIVGPLGVERMMFLSFNVLQRILVSDWTVFPRPDYLRNALGISTGYGLLTVTGSEHKRMRRAINPAFSLQNIIAQTDMYYPPIEGIIKILHDSISSQENSGKGVEVHMYDWLSKVTLDIICSTGFGYHADSVHNPDDELACAYHQLLRHQNGPNFQGFCAFLAIPGIPQLLRTEFAYRYREWLFPTSLAAPLRDLLSSRHRVKIVSHKIIAERLAEVDMHDGQSKRDIMSILIRARRNKEGEGYSMQDQDLVDQVLTFLGGGHETTSAGIAWTLWLLANDPAAQSRLREEVTPVVEQDPRPGYRSLKECQWLDCVVMESLRVLPPVPFTSRRADASTWIEGMFVPKGTLFFIPIRVVNTWPQIWGEDAKEFRPARWLELPPTYNATFSLLSFIAGPHGCIGRTMAILEMKAVLAVLIAHFSFAPAYENQVAKPASAIIMRPEDGLPLRVTAVGTIPVPA